MSATSSPTTEGVTEFVSRLLQVGEKSARLARSIRANEELFPHLCKEKTIDANKRFLVDFKTLTDVLIQELVKLELGQRYPSLRDYIQGEENNTFTINDQEILIDLASPHFSTSLLRILNNNKTATDALLAIIQEKNPTSPATEAELKKVKSLCGNECFNTSNVGMWIDPLDGTNEYIKGGNETVNSDNIFPGGLQVVTVLIGVYDRTSGIPLIGVVNQPFYGYKKLNDKIEYTGRTLWGVALESGFRATNATPRSVEKKKIVVMSSSESEYARSYYEKNEETASVYFPAGAGYKVLTVITGDADAYILSKDSTFKWDTCGPHAILRASGGGIQTRQQQKEGKKFELVDVKYHRPDDGATGTKKWSNKTGFIAFSPHVSPTDFTYVWGEYQKSDWVPANSTTKPTTATATATSTPTTATATATATATSTSTTKKEIRERDEDESEKPKKKVRQLSGEIDKCENKS